MGVTVWVCLCAEANINLREHGGRRPIDMLNNKVSFETKSKSVCSSLMSFQFFHLVSHRASL